MRTLALALLLANLALADDLPKVLDDRLKLELIAEAPVVRTPTGIAIDDKGRVYVIESHTHFPPNDYDGPKTDRILRFEKKGDKWESSVFLEGKKHTMGCGFHPNGWLYIATRNLICRVKDKNENGQIDLNEAGEHDCLVTHETKGDYPHNGLSGFAFDFAGNVYFGQGENLGVDYTLHGQDGTKLTGGGEGGNIYCCDAEGKKLRRVATGFWNPFHMYMDPFGRLFAVDNDPDSRPPCRLLHIVEGGDYGYRFRNGRKGTHPFTSWNGELPGTLPMVSGTGEAPSGMIGAIDAGLPEEYASDLLVTSWGDHRIEAYPLKPRGASFSAEMKPLIRGGENFRPVGIANHPDGSIWITDWVDKSYQLHGKGRLWRLSWPELDIKRFRGRHAPVDVTLESIEGTDSMQETIRKANGQPAVAHAILKLAEESKADASETRVRLFLLAPWDVKPLALGGALGTPPSFVNRHWVYEFTEKSNRGDIRYAAARCLDPTKQRERLLELLGDPDPFIQQAARWALKPAAQELTGFAFAEEKRPATRIGVALVLREANIKDGQKRIAELLKDSDPLVRFVAIQWIGEARLKDVWNEVKDDLEKRLATRQELEAFLATSAFLSDEKYDPRKESRGEEFVVKMLLDKNTAPARQAFLLRMLRADHPALNDGLLQKWLEGENADLRLAVLQTIAQRSTPPGFINLGAVSQDEARPVEERVEAIASMVADPARYEGILKEFVQREKNPLLATQAGRTIRTDQKLAAKYSIAFGPDGRNLATDLEGWKAVVDKQPGDAKSGALVFHHAVSLCSRCHEANGRGAAIGPNLTGIGKTMTRERLIESIIQPSKEIAPQFAVWQIVTTDGKIQRGMYKDEEVDGTVIYADEQGKTFKVHPRNVQERTQEKKSIMPDGLAYRLTDQELRDLLAYLSR